MNLQLRQLPMICVGELLAFLTIVCDIAIGKNKAWEIYVAGDICCTRTWAWVIILDQCSATNASVFPQILACCEQYQQYREWGLYCHAGWQFRSLKYNVNIVHIGHCCFHFTVVRILGPPFSLSTCFERTNHPDHFLSLYSSQLISNPFQSLLISCCSCCSCCSSFFPLPDMALEIYVLRA